MASVIIEKRVGKTGNISHRAKIQQTHEGKVIERLSKTFKTKALAKTWANKIKGSSPILMENGVKWVAWRSSKHHPSLPYYLLCKA